jgi:hypothetical protein
MAIWGGGRPGIITHFGGAIDVKSAPGEGSAFTIYLRRSAVTLATAESGQATPP